VGKGALFARRAHAVEPVDGAVRVGTAHATERIERPFIIGVRLCPPYRNSKLNNPRKESRCL